MKKLMFAAMLALTGCDYDCDYDGKTRDITVSVRKVEVDGHLYLYVVGYYANGGICHAESCPCKVKDCHE